MPSRKHALAWHDYPALKAEGLSDAAIAQRWNIPRRSFIRCKSLEYAGAPQSAPERTTKPGFVIACDLSEAIDAYAQTSGRRIRDILDAALRGYLAQVTGEKARHA